MSDIAHDDPVQGPVIMTFDGRVLELFTERLASTTRMITGMLHVEVGEPNRKGVREVAFSCAPGRRSGGGCRLWVQEDRWPAVEPFVREVAAAVAR